LTFHGSIGIWAVALIEFVRLGRTDGTFRNRIIKSPTRSRIPCLFVPQNVGRGNPCSSKSFEPRDDPKLSTDGGRQATRNDNINKYWCILDGRRAVAIVWSYGGAGAEKTSFQNFSHRYRPTSRSRLFGSYDVIIG